MTPRELLEACEFMETSWDKSLSRASVAHDMRLVLNHVRATIHADDGTPPTPEWCEAVTLGVGRGENGAWCAFGNTPDTFRAMSIWADSSGVRLCAGETTVKLDPTRRDVRRLAEIVGVKLKEGTMPDEAAIAESRRILEESARDQVLSAEAWAAIEAAVKNGTARPRFPLRGLPTRVTEPKEPDHAEP